MTQDVPAIAQGAFRAMFVYDVADTIDLAQLRTVLGQGVARAPLQLRREASSEFIQYPVAPLIVRLPDLERPEASVRAKIFDFGVVSIRITVPFAGTWDDFAALTRRLRGDPALEAQARAGLDAVLAEIRPALDEPHAALVEDYFILEVERFASELDSRTLTAEYGPALARLVLFEDRPLFGGEVNEALRLAFSYYPDDLAILQWDAAFVYDRADGAEAVEDILEFANAQLVEFRTYDARLDGELDAIYRFDAGRPARRFGSGGQAADRAAKVRYLLVDVLELTDRATNALKIIGDAYYARLYRAVAGRLGLADWQRQIDAKLRSVSEMYRVFQDQAQYARSQMLEIVIIVLIAFEAVIGVLALRH
ncbi:MAG: hypothetical protein JWO66_1668 [Candidatus Eremiobacteraeota bacterium]|nr:hypothetical protein [Candidatus Eremiobacteraeota bacterium]